MIPSAGTWDAIAIPIARLGHYPEGLAIQVGRIAGDHIDAGPLSPVDLIP